MSEDSITLKSPLPYQIAIFLFVNIWAAITFEVAQYKLVSLYENLVGWIGWGTIVLWSITPLLMVSSWKLKDRVEVYDPIWTVKVREVNLGEYEEMVKNYNSTYRYLLASFDPLLLLLIITSYLVFITLPFYTMSSTLLLISSTPLLLALIALVFGLLFAFFTFKLIPNSASREFPKHNPRRFRKAISYLLGLPGIFWSGIRLSIGESRGFYTIRDPIPVARVEGLEGAARIECETDTSGTITRVKPIFEKDNLQESEVFTITSPFTTVDVVKLIQSIIDDYIKQSGSRDMLDDVLEDIVIFLAKYEPLN